MTLHPILLPEHHHEIEAACVAVQAAARGDDRRELVACYRAMEREVLQHLAAEELYILPAYARAEPDDARAIRAEHDEVRKLLFDIGVEVEIHSVRARTLDLLVETLRTHSRHEDGRMYPWAQAHLSPHRRRQLLVGITRSLQDLQRIRSRFARSPDRTAARHDVHE